MVAEIYVAGAGAGSAQVKSFKIWSEELRPHLSTADGVV